MVLICCQGVVSCIHHSPPFWCPFLQDCLFQVLWPCMCMCLHHLDLPFWSATHLFLWRSGHLCENQFIAIFLLHVYGLLYENSNCFNFSWDQKTSHPEVGQSLQMLFEDTVDIGYKAGGGTRKNWPYNQYGLISDIPMEGPGEGGERANMSWDRNLVKKVQWLSC